MRKSTRSTVLINENDSFFQKLDAEDADIDEEVSTPFPDLMEVSRCFEACGVSVELVLNGNQDSVPSTK